LGVNQEEEEEEEEEMEGVPSVDNLLLNNHL
jgi:hypothetical protein